MGVCSNINCCPVLPDGPVDISGQELSGEYYENAKPVVELQIAKAGYRLASWLDLIAAQLGSSDESLPVGDL